MKKVLFIFIVFIFINIILLANEIDTIEKALIIADNRINQGILLSNISDEKSFENQASRQIEFAFIALDAKDLLTEDWFDLSLYCLARKNKYYNLAIRILKKEYEIEQYTKLKRWIKKRITLLEQKSFYEENFDIKEELQDLKKKVLES